MNQTTKQLERPWTVYLVHHSHTDIGYTDTQQKITRYHRSFIDDLLVRHAEWKKGESRLRSFRWTNECFWSIEQWLEKRKPEEVRRLVEAIQDGFIGLTSSYLHFDEMIDASLMATVLGRVQNFAAEHGLQADTALHADINGFSWGYAQALHDTGTRNLVSLLHSIHGRHPIGVVQAPFWWKTPGGDSLLVWNGEQYMLGNALGLAPGALLNYVFHDENTPTINDPDNRKWAKIRLPRYLRQLELDGYPVDYTMVGVGGTMSDNDPPNYLIAEFIDQWNADYGDRIRLEMTTPSDYMAKVRESWPDIPTYSGDWPDWWSDGLASMPMATRLCRAAQRQSHRLDYLGKIPDVTIDPEKKASMDTSIALYCEHTFGHSDSIKTPWAECTQHIALLKTRLAAEALGTSKDIEDDVRESMGEAPMTPFRPFTYRVHNPFDEAVYAHVPLYLEYCDHHVRDILPRILRCDDESELPFQREEAPRGFNYLVEVDLKPGEDVYFEMAEGLPTARYKNPIGTDAVLPNLADNTTSHLN